MSKEGDEYIARLQAEQFKPMSEAGAIMHELYLSWVEGGFTREEALYLVYLTVSKGGPWGQPPSEQD